MVSLKLKIFTEEQKRKYIKTEREISKILTDDSQFKYACSDLIENIIKNCRGVKKSNDGINRMEKEEQRDSFSTLKEFKENDIINREEYIIASQIEQVFANEKIKPQHFVLNKYYIDFYFPEHKLAVEIDEKAHLDRNEDQDKKIQYEIKEELDCEFIKINPGKECFNVNIEFGKIHNHIIESIKKLTKESLVDKLPSELLRLELEKTIQQKYVVKKILPTL